ncbi:ABC transporter permease [Paenibacillus fonticola]|uniref:ABC transporter permease n=1 Tax=Paenibacillus fonticola TaxID=379896 RepID=UPI0003687095|nr:FtsX-like permease family protein [Paenibacillus fonticola]
MFFKSAWRSLLRSKLRTFFTVFSIIVGITCFFLMFSLAELAPHSIRNSAKTMLGGDLLVQSYLKPLKHSQIGSLFDKDENINYLASYVSQTMIKSQSRTTSVIIKGIDPTKYPYYGVEQFENIRNMQKDSILLSKGAADRLQAKVGDKVSIPNSLDGTMQSFTLTGIVHNVEESYGDANVFGAGYVNLNQLYSILNIDTESVNEILFQIPAANESQVIKEQLKEYIPGIDIITLNDKVQQRLQDMKTLLPVLQIFSLLALGICSITVSNTMRVTMLSRMRDIAAMKAIGLKNRQIRFFFLGESAIMGICGTLIGIGIGLLVNIWLTTYLGRMLSVPLYGHISFRTIGVSFFLGLFIPVFSSWTSLGGMIFIRPMDLLKDTTMSLPPLKRSFWRKRLYDLLVTFFCALYLQKTLFIDSSRSWIMKVLITWCVVFLVFLIIIILVRCIAFLFSLFFGFIGSLRRFAPQRWYVPLHNLSSFKKTNSLLTVTLTVGVLSAVMSHMIAENLIDSVKTQLETESKGNLLVTSSIQDEMSVEERFKAINIDKWSKGIQLSGFLNGINSNDILPILQEKGKNNKFFSTNRLSIEGTNTGDLMRPYKIESGRDLTTSDGLQKSALLLEDYKNLGFELGDTISIGIGTKVIELKIVGFFQSGIVKTVQMRIPMNTLLQYGSPSRISYSIDVPSANTDKVLQQLNENLPSSAMAYLISDTASDSLKYIIKMQSTFFSVVTLFAFITAILMIGNQIVIGLIQKNRDIAIFKAIGSSSKKIMVDVLLENLIISFVAGLVGVTMSIMLTSAVILLVFHTSLVVNKAWILYGIGLSVITTEAVVWLAARQSLQTKPMQMLRQVG